MFINKQCKTISVNILEEKTLVYVSSVKKTKPTKPYTVAIVKLLLGLIWSMLLQITS